MSSLLRQQYQKAWLASFPADLWPAKEEADDDGMVYLRLRDGTRLLAVCAGVDQRSAEGGTMSKRCEAMTKAGNRCKAVAVEGGLWAFHADPTLHFRPIQYAIPG